MNSPDITYVLPLRRDRISSDDELFDYLRVIVSWIPVIVVDGSPSNVFEHHHASLPSAILHVPVDEDRHDANGKVSGVITGMRRVKTTLAIIADDDVRYDRAVLERMARLLGSADIVRPQNYFAPKVWHALLDTGRTLIARATGGDWPGTLGVRTHSFWRMGGYSGDVLFENLELSRTIEAGGGRQLNALDCFVVRRPPSLGHYLNQRVRQAYDELARPARFLFQLTMLPALVMARRRPVLIGSAIVLSILVAEAGRRKAGGEAVFPLVASLLAPLWILERAITSWIALFVRVFFGGVDYGGRRIPRAAHSVGELRKRAI